MVPVNFSVSSQGNATWVILATTICCMHEEERILPKYILGRVSVITVISHILNSKVVQKYMIELFGTEVDLSDTNQQPGRQTRPKHHTI